MCVGINETEATDSRRDQILEFIKAHPGAHLREIRRTLNFAMGVIQYHLYTLEKEKKIVSRRKGLYKRFYRTLVFGNEQLEILNMLSQETERDIVLYLMEHPEATQKQLSEYAQISAGSINWHMKRLIDDNLIQARHEGLFVRYVVKGNHLEILTLLKTYHPNAWEKWADRLADIFTELSTVAETEKTRKEEGRK
jgi:predicted transcriptional regulator